MADDAGDEVGSKQSGGKKMGIMQKSSKAEDRPLESWFDDIRMGRLTVPRFQRGEEWDRSRITSFLNAIMNNLPVGVALVLEVADREKFSNSRFISTAVPSTAQRVIQNLLDGQQRLTAFWRAMHNNYESETYFVYIPEFDKTSSEKGKDIEIRFQPRWRNKVDARMPRWADEPPSCFLRGLIPVSLLRPGDILTEIDNWLNLATNEMKPQSTDEEAFIKLEKFNKQREYTKEVITQLRYRIALYNLPYLSLPSDTRKDIALQVFINMNTNSKPLDLYDIVVAEVEAATEKSLHALERALVEKCPRAIHYGNVRDLILSTSALLQDKLPNNRGVIEMDEELLLGNWTKLERGLEQMAEFLETQGVFDRDRLPTNAVLAVIAAAYEKIPDVGDIRGKAQKLLRRYLWSAFFTDRYENTAASRAYADFNAIKTLLDNPSFSDNDIPAVPILDRNQHPLADVDSLIAARWPKAIGIKSRGILAVTTYFGALDFADHAKANYDSLQHREYHHVFPDALLREAGIDSYLALNCALITWKTNRVIGRKDPLEYLKERVVWSGEDEVRYRLRSHLISYEALSKATYAGLTGGALKERLEPEFTRFIRERAEMVEGAISQLASGNMPALETLWAARSADVCAGVG